MYRVEEILNELDQALGSKRQRQLAGGILLSVSLLFAGLALTVMTLKGKENGK